MWSKLAIAAALAITFLIIGVIGLAVMELLSTREEIETRPAPRAAPTPEQAPTNASEGEPSAASGLRQRRDFESWRPASHDMGAAT